MIAPTLRTERLILRGPEPRDWPAFRDFYASGRSIYVGGPKNLKAAWMHFAAEFGHWQIRGFGMWTVTRDGDAPIGIVGGWFPEGWPEQELGWLMWEGHEGQGYAFEAATAARAHVYGTLNWPTAVSYIDRGNARSIALAERLGCTYEPAAAHPNPDALVYRHPSPQELAK